MAEKYVIGLDYGTLSGRAILVNAENGRTVAQSVKNYTHGVLEKALQDGTPLPASARSGDSPPGRTSDGVRHIRLRHALLGAGGCCARYFRDGKGRHSAGVLRL